MFQGMNVLVTFNPDDVLRDKILSSLQLANLQIPRAANLQTYQVIDSRDRICTSFADIEDGQLYSFTVPAFFPPAPASEWTERHVSTLLKVEFHDDYDFIGNHVQTQLAATVLDELDDVDGNNLMRRYHTKALSLEELQDFRNVNATALTTPLKKAMYAVEKFTNNEATVDSFLNLLLYKLGYYEQWLLPIPQHKFQLEFTDCTKEAICDFCIIDVVSFAVMAISEDKIVNNQCVNSEGQLFAEMIAATMQLIRGKKRKFPYEEVQLTPTERKMFGLRVNGLIFHFYEVEVSDSMLQAVRSGRATSNATTVHCRRNLDMRDKEDRKVIVNILDTWRGAMDQAGQRSERLPSTGNA